jgi:sugar lactone lactonase YvrE
MRIPTRFAILSSLHLALWGGASLGCGDRDSRAARATTDAGTAPDAAVGDCEAVGSGTISIVVTGLPAGVAAKVKITLPTGATTDATSSTTLADAAAGTYEVSAERVAQPDPIVRTLYEPTASASSVCLKDTRTETITIPYAPIPSSHKLWAPSAEGPARFAGFAGGDLRASGTPAATVSMMAPVTNGAGKSVAFDRDGNLWSVGPTSTGARLVRFAAADLGTSGDKAPDREIALNVGDCIPHPSRLAFDPTGALWVMPPCLGLILRVSPERLATSSENPPGDEDVLRIEGVYPSDIAFDAAGNLWVSGATDLYHFSASSLAAGERYGPTFQISPRTEENAALPGDAFAFDQGGNLWAVNTGGGNVIFALSPTDLAAPAGDTFKAVVASIRIYLGESARPHSIAIDESGGVWLTYDHGKLARLAPDQLGVSSTPMAPTVPETFITSAELGYPEGLAFFPAPAGLPLYGRFE